jgi:hypothetical protein
LAPGTRGFPGPVRLADKAVYLRAMHTTMLDFVHMLDFVLIRGCDTVKKNVIAPSDPGPKLGRSGQ